MCNPHASDIDVVDYWVGINYSQYALMRIYNIVTQIIFNSELHAFIMLLLALILDLSMLVSLNPDFFM
jgi:hypothetical protein